MRNQKGITLIALIITIIVMLILVGVSVSVALNTGLFKSAQGAAKNTQATAEAETALSNGTINIDGKGEISMDNYEASLKGEDGEDAKWEWTDNQGEGTEGHGEISVGDLVTYKEKTTEQFYVISVDGDTVAMLAAKNITTTGELVQSNSAPTITFSSTNYWSSASGIAYPDANGKYPGLNDEITYPKGDATSIITIAKAYGQSLGVDTGRLMTVEEVVALDGDTGSHSTSACPAFINAQRYWLGSADSTISVWVVYGGFGVLGSGRFDLKDGFGVRPVVEILKSDI